MKFIDIHIFKLAFLLRHYLTENMQLFCGIMTEIFDTRASFVWKAFSSVPLGKWFSFIQMHFRVTGLWNLYQKN